MASNGLMQAIRDVQARTPFVVECQRLLSARLAATTKEEKDDTEWALTFLLQMQGAGRFAEYQAMQEEREARTA